MMTEKIFLAVIYLGLTFTSLAKGQYFPDRPRNMFNPPSPPQGNPFLQQFHPQNFGPAFQSPGFNHNPQNARPIPNFSSFPPPNFSTFPLFPQSTPVQMNQPTIPQNPVPYNPTYNPQRPSSSLPYPQQNNPFNPGAPGPGPMFTNPQLASPFNHGAQDPAPMFNNPQQASPLNRGAQSSIPPFNYPQQTSPFNRSPDNIFTNPHPTDSFVTRPQQASPLSHPPTSFISTPIDTINPSTLRLIEEALTRPQQGSPSYISPQNTAPTSPNLQQTRPFNPEPTSVLPFPTKIVNPSTLENQANNPVFTSPEQNNPSYTNPQKNIPISPAPSDFTVPQKPPSDSAVPQPEDSMSTVPQQPTSDSTIPQKPASDSTVSQPTDSKPTVPQEPASDSTVPQNPASDSTDSKPTVSQQPASYSTVPEKTVVPSDDIQPISSASETSSSVSNVPQDSGSVPAAPQPPAHIPHNRSSTTQYIPSSGKQTDFPARDPLRGFRIVCLFNNRHFYRNGFTPAKLEPHLCTHLNYEFAVLDPKTHEMIVGEPDLDMDMNFYEEAIALKRFNPKLKVLVSLGGWSDSTKKYSELASDPAKRTNFVAKAIEFLSKHEFDGMDLAWEYPNCWQGAIGISPKDKANFVALLKDIKEGFKEHGLLLSISVGAIKREVDAAYDVPAISKIVDYINVMTYDMHGPWEPVTGHHVQFNSKPDDKDPYCCVLGGIRAWIEKGAPKKKLNMGLALYGRTYTLQNPHQCGMGVPAVGPGNPGPVTKEGGIMNYHEICDFLNSGKWVEKEDKLAGFYACSDDGQWVGYDPPVMMVRKVKYVVENKLGGVLLKDLSGDDSDGDCFNMPFPILKMVKMEMVHKAKHVYP